MDWSIEELLGRLQVRDECNRIEAKESKTTLGKSALETISAFSNEPDLGGGYLVLGLKKNDSETSNERYIVQGVDDPDKVQQELAGVCRDTFNIRIRPKIYVHHYNGRNIIVAFIPEAFCRDKPIFIESKGVEKGSFRRIGSGDHYCTAEDLDLLYQSRRQQHYESDVLNDVSWEDISPKAIEEYRRLRARIDPNAEELKLDDQGLLLSLKTAIKKNGEVIPTIGGLLLFGTKAALRREMPMAARLDYIIVEGIEWVPDPSKRYSYAIDYREALVTLMPHLHSQIMSDLPTKFGLEEGHLQRTDTPYIPRDVIREAIANALMHRDYRSHQPTQIIRYSNRLEFRNAGYSLKPIEELGEPGSKPRNPLIAAVFHELKHAEAKGTGIRAMRECMQKAGLSTPPIIESKREGNEFDLILLPHHLLDRETLEWLSQFGDIDLSDAQRQALAFTRAVGAITNQDYRQLNGTDTLAASSALRGLRDANFLHAKGKGNGTYYVLGPRVTERTPYTSLPDKEEASLISLGDKGVTPQISALSEGLTPHISHLREGLTPHISPLCKGLEAIPKGFPPLPEELKQQLASLGERSKRGEIKDLIKKLCSLGPLQLTQLAQILGRNPRHLRDRHLSKMVGKRELVYQYPNQPAHPQQAYRVPEGEK